MAFITLYIKRFSWIHPNLHKILPNIKYIDDQRVFEACKEMRRPVSYASTSDLTKPKKGYWSLPLPSLDSDKIEEDSPKSDSIFVEGFLSVSSKGGYAWIFPEFTLDLGQSHIAQIGQFWFYSK